MVTVDFARWDYLPCNTSCIDSCRPFTRNYTYYITLWLLSVVRTLLLGLSLHSKNHIHNSNDCNIFIIGMYSFMYYTLWHLIVGRVRSLAIKIFCRGVTPRFLNLQGCIFCIIMGWGKFYLKKETQPKTTLKSLKTR